MNYKSLLYEIQESMLASPTPETIILPTGKQLYEIDLSTRTINGPETLSVQSDHYAETVYFLVDRYYDSMDLAQTNCIVQYVTNGQSYVYTVPFCDTTTYEGKMIIPWTISASATENAGLVQYFVRFYLIDEASIRDASSGEQDTTNAQFSYSLSTLTASSRVLKTLPQEDFVNEDSALKLPEKYFEIIDIFSRMVDNSTVYWIEV